MRRAVLCERAPLVLTVAKIRTTRHSAALERSFRRRPVRDTRSSFMLGT